MSQIVDLKGNAVDVPDGYGDAAAALRKMLEQIERGELKLERWIMAYETTHPTDPSMVRSGTDSSPLTISESVYMLECAKFDIIRKAREP